MSDAYSGSSPFDQQVEKATPDSSAEANWALLLEICDKAGQSTTGPKDCLKSVMKRLASSSKNVRVHALTLLDTCVLNCGVAFHREVATAEFVKHSRNFLTKASPSEADKFKENLKKWAENEFKSDSKLSVIPTFYQALRTEGAYFGMASSSGTTNSTTASTSLASGEDDLEKAIALSLKESQSKSQSTSLYPSMSTLASAAPAAAVAAPHHETFSSPQAAQQPAGLQVRALYDFEAVEDNELTFKAGEIITVLDSSDPNWWKGATWRGEGLFPVNFASTELTEANDVGSTTKRSVQFNEEVQVEQFDPNSVQIDESVIDSALDHIQNADPTGSTEDSTEMTNLEEECKVMGPLIDQELEKTDSKHNELMKLNEKLTEAFQLYTELMKDATNITQQYPPAVSYVPPGTGISSTYLPAQPQEQPTYTYNTQDPQAYYTGGGYPNQMAVGPSPEQQAGLLQQYSVGSTALTDIPYMTTTAGLHQPQMYNASQTSYQ